MRPVDDRESVDECEPVADQEAAKLRALGLELTDDVDDYLRWLDELRPGLPGDVTTPGQ